MARQAYSRRPAALFMTPAITGLLARHTGLEVDAEQARDGLGCLHRLNLITEDPCSGTRTVRVHALVQRATRDALPATRFAALASAAADALLGIWPDPERDAALGQVLRANTDTLAAGATSAARHPLWALGPAAVFLPEAAAVLDTLISGYLG
ncbi:hypothetical protein [Amycolatopsis sp. cg9]|uniref:hypothetical protein n=1 Tax=Amycolatopsis sp. cg9 TaxID=3238801 RepID=UPI003524BE78